MLVLFDIMGWKVSSQPNRLSCKPPAMQRRTTFSFLQFYKIGIFSNQPYPCWIIRIGLKTRSRQERQPCEQVQKWLRVLCPSMKRNFHRQIEKQYFHHSYTICIIWIGQKSSKDPRKIVRWTSSRLRALHLCTQPEFTQESKTRNEKRKFEPGSCWSVYWNIPACLQTWAAISNSTLIFLFSTLESLLNRHQVFSIQESKQIKWDLNLLISRFLPENRLKSKLGFRVMCISRHTLLATIQTI